MRSHRMRKLSLHFQQLRSSMLKDIFEGTRTNNMYKN